MKHVFMMLLMACANVVMAAGTVVIKSVEAHQRYPWNGLVDVVVTLEGSSDDIANTKCTFVATNSANDAAVQVVSIVTKGSDTGSGTTWIRRFIWNATNDVGAVKIDDLALVVEAKGLTGVQLWENGPFWAECNVGALNPEEYGYYFCWGDVVGCRRVGDSWVATDESRSGFVFDYESCETMKMDDTVLRSRGFVDATGNLVSAHDAATAHLNSPWRMPTNAEFIELIDNCDATCTTRNGVWGLLVTGRGVYASKSIFLPGAGYGVDSAISGSGFYGCYWSSTRVPGDYYNYAWGINFSGSLFFRNGDWRYMGQPVRPLRAVDSEVTRGVRAGVATHLKLDCRMGVRDCAIEGEALRFDASWCENGDQVKILYNGVVLTNGVSGVYCWMPMPYCSTQRHVFRLEIISAGQVVGVETAEFSCAAPTLEHATVVSLPAIDPTSSAPGMTAEIRCSRCGEIVQAATEIPALGYIRNVMARSVWPYNKVTVSYTLADDIGEILSAEEKLVVSAESSLDGILAVARTVIGDTGCSPGLHCVVWDVDADRVYLSASNIYFVVQYGSATGISASVTFPVDILPELDQHVLPDFGATFHVDAGDSATMTIVSEGSVRYVTRWNDASGGAVSAVADSTHRPYLSEYNGKTVVDFGDIRINGGDWPADSAWMTWNRSVSTIREVFIVCCDHITDTAERAERQFVLTDSSTYSFHRYYRQLFSLENASSNVRNGIVQIDGKTVAYDAELPEGLHLIRVQTTAAESADSFCRDRDCRWGGLRIAELIIYDAPLSDDDANRVSQYLMSKWLMQNESIVLPDIGETPSAADVAAVVADATDQKVTANIDETNYNDFRDWAGTVKTQGGSAAGASGVMSADTAWLSYALGQGTLLESAPTDEDLSVEAFEPAAESGKFDFTVSVKDVEVGSEAAKENLKKVFGLEGAATLESAAFSSDKVDIEFGAPVDGKVKFTAGPKDASAASFFMKVKVLP